MYPDLQKLLVLKNKFDKRQDEMAAVLNAIDMYGKVVVDVQKEITKL